MRAMSLRTWLIILIFACHLITTFYVINFTTYSCYRRRNAQGTSSDDRSDFYYDQGGDDYDENIPLDSVPLPAGQSISSEVRPNVSTLLDPLLVPTNVFYVWCGRRWFEFHHYISVLSVIRTLQPDNIIFYYDFLPVEDNWIYNTWFSELREQFPFLRLRELTGNEGACEGHTMPSLPFIFKKLTYGSGGMYVNEHTILTRFPLSHRNYSIVDALDKRTRHGLLMSRAGLPGNYDQEKWALQSDLKTRRFSCSSREEFIASQRKSLCISDPKVFYPKDIWDRRDAFGRLVRRLFYKSSRIPIPQPSYEELVPNIAHIVWIGGGRMDLLFYLCVLSLLHVANVDTVYIHGDAPPSGVYWERMKHDPRVVHIFRELPQTVYGNKVEVLSHITDVWRVDFMVKYGGIYVDTDTAFVKPLDRTIRGYDAVATYDWTYWNHPFPDTINFGVTIGKRNARFWQLFQESMRWFIDSDWAWNGLRQPYKIKERHPELLRVDPRLQITCFRFKCHPTWWPDYHNESVHHLNTNSIKNWTTDGYVFHWTLPTPPELENEENLAASTTIFADIARFILRKAGVY